ncbi:Myosin regulatory light chain cdc4 isoform B [Neolecta irregularis DAH-3]|uniref:Myosin regulatory light chain cdc4 isoform A n=1 Tax=Neolecta irregularis (strain DAH-3) TaxID=1198029 RepID=A0A1U7LLL7_NEOID|nr:Myosin regulatory light chain cdc4 isoform A [Neolecta irregularis DAH-3]OLL23412.1 Myosin regulatory light chain cdc4 isoform B [Neolecta irregularis DAH-3]|eukprot:OLL23411.1 Myosin regulatory light chain cdc4 isoform A [Neolecta irregularis DAH-3]
MAAIRPSDAKLTDAFNLYDKKGNGRIPLKSLGDLLRSVGQNPTLREVADLEEEVGGDVDFATFRALASRPEAYGPASNPEDFARGFQVFDKDMTGYIGVGELRYVLTSLGEKLSDEEVDELLKGVNIGKNGEVNYQEFVRMILAG